MSYQVLARKWRPRRFVETVGQEHVLKALVNALDENRLHHAYLFTGTRGVGKTSIARLFAKALNCQEGVSSEPCGRCSSCIEIAEGRFVDLIEVDAASRTKVEDTRELLENVQYAPTQGRYKVYLIDEVHMLSTSSFNALLKTLEEPPPHVKFLLATTDPQKLPVTILSRCLQFNLKNMAPEKIVSHLQFVLGEESIPFDDASLWLIARSADGSMRDALSLTDQAIAFGSGALREGDVRAMLGTIDHRLVFDLLDAIVAGDGKATIDRVAAMAEFSPDFAGVLAEMISILHRVALAQVVPAAIDNSLGDQAQIQALAGKVRAEEIQLYYQIALTGRRDLPMSPNPREALEMCLLRMLAFRPVDQRPIDAPPVKPSEISRPVENEPAVSEPEPQPAIETPVVEKPLETQATLAQPESAPVNDPPPWEDIPAEAYADQEPTAKKFEADSMEAVSAPLESARVEPSEPFKPAEPMDKLMDEPAIDPVESNDSAIDLFGEETPLATYDKPDEQPVVEEVKPVEAVEPVEQKEQAKKTLEKSITLSNFALEDWVHLIAQLDLTGMTESLAKAMSLETLQGNRMVLHYTAEQEALFNDQHKQRIADAITAFFQEPMSVDFQLAEQTRETPVNYRIRRAEERRIAAVRHLKQDPNVERLIEMFDGQLDELSVEPLEIE
ncbi:MULTISPECIES: DNA polymerase III subunit gamma/tau [unclassified Marinobacterium]|jgi:DNA polymerase III subunit gamma/tau|uniref:DNA polymerase III subunit gamma/tau n=1 Tax=unclassified Marinobacterium TaxID=2644139 RepID=UPI001568E263|nr:MULTISPECIES: DNA polymerase III subunit gamma/tau [unclassified Marinobacterium]NRP10309.1 DNA polymerase III subunit tau [Marinobacterium sp. xm-g-48]NRP37200.1 DNA polymerase III subunit tau [Marinobacterium sp. xm-d-579]NRP46989.1 DNA polymerase III subunit tau [Marinobacterium sp. xm-d-543]NRP53127.1 DNA polymerase III subunit tau [Marinobacterium sp. xm-v-242]NRP59657.1 DNA polymerase III subunit tau [Marinobacterium sp. xm-d-564]